MVSRLYWSNKNGCDTENYNKDEKLEFNYKRACGLWLIVVALVISVATLIGGKQIINMQFGA